MKNLSHNLFVAILVPMLCLVGITASAQHKLISSDKALYTISLSPEATADELHAAAELQKYLELASGITLPISSEELRKRAPRITIGASGADAVEGSFSIESINPRAISITGAGRGVVYAVYELLEQLGFRYYATDGLVVPQLAEGIILAENLSHKWVPTFTFRDTYYTPTWDKLYIDWHRQSHNEKGEKPEWGVWVHTYFQLLSPTEYYESNPEYFALREGKRVATQLCLSNEKVFQIVIKNLALKMEQNPKAKYWSVSNEDNFGYCECAKCKKMDDIDGSPTGSVLQFADRVAREFPDKVISTLAYQYSRAAPKTTLPSDNLNIMFCNIECNRSKSIVDDPTSASFVKDMKQWAAITDNILVWDYIIQFKNLVSPFPNFHTLQPNIEFFVNSGVVAIFEQGNRDTGGEFANLRSYVVSKLLINPLASTDSLITDFCSGYYGAGGLFVKEYIDLITKNLIESDAPLLIFGSPCDKSATDSWLSPQNIDIYHSIFDRAEAAVATDVDKLAKVRYARQPLYYAELEQARLEPYGARGMFVERDGKWRRNPEFAAKLEMFVERCREEGVSKLSEWHTTPEEYLVMMRTASELQNEGVLSFKKEYHISPQPHAKYNRDKNQNLTDGVFGTNDYKVQWLGFDAQTIDVTVDLGSMQDISAVSGHFLQVLSDWIFYPTLVEIFVSEDGDSFQWVGKAENPLVRDVQTASKTIEVELPTTPKARYVRMKVHSVGICPPWHLGAGGRAFMFIDEIMVK